MNRQGELNIGFVMEHEKLRWNTNSFWGPEMALFVYTSSRWGVDSSCEGLPDSNIGSSYQPAPTTDSSALVRCVYKGKKRVLSPVTHSPSPPLLPTRRQPVHPYGGVISMGVRTCVLTPFPPTLVKSRSVCFPLVLAFPSYYASGVLCRTFPPVVSVPALTGLPFDLERLCFPPRPVTRPPSI